MAKKKKRNNTNSLVLIIIGAMIVVLLCVLLFSSGKRKSIIFTFNETNIKVKIGEIKSIDYTISDDSVPIEWISNGDAVIIDDNGYIHGNKYGQAVVYGIVSDGDKTITNTCYVTTYTGDINVNVSKIEVNDGYLLMNNNSEYHNPFTIVPNNAYIESIEYYSSNENVAKIDSDKIVSLNNGSAIISMVINKQITKDLQVEVTNTDHAPGFVKKVSSVSFNENDIKMEIGDTKEVKYKISPSDGYVSTIEWNSSNEKVVTVKDGVITAINSGESIVQVVVNGNIKASITVRVNNKPTPTPTTIPTNAVIVVDKEPKSTIKVGERTDIIAHVEPQNSTKDIRYISNNTKVATVDQNGIITGVGPGKTTITLFMGSGKAKYISITVGNSNPTYVWGYTSSKAKDPVYAGKSFFQNLASKGRGAFDGSSYYVTSSVGSFVYNLNTSVLSVGGRTINVRIYYPPETDLSAASTVVYMGGDGEKDFDGYFATIAANPSELRSSGILILVAEGNGKAFDGDAAIAATRFVQVITNQKSGVNNSILGFSTGGKFVIDAANKFNYYKTVVFSSWCPDPASTVNVKNKDVMYFIPYNDGLYRLAKETLIELRNYGYKKVTLVTNSNELLNMFNGSGFKVVNAGSGMVSAHASRNVRLSGVISYVND